PKMKQALNIFFEDFVNSLELRPYAEELLRKLSQTHKLGLISNFTYAPVVYSSLRKLGISDFFNVVTVSDDNGWRKPHSKIFQDTINRLKVEIGNIVYIGDSPSEDIKGALDAGLKTVFVSSQFYSLNDLMQSGHKPHYIIADLGEVCKDLSPFGS
ncbi:MAG: HAD family hydrolase, partial [Crenarchaeota archaeon]|nr:HAD family hydrolase [Thermoproteota archaeon]